MPFHRLPKDLKMKLGRKPKSFRTRTSGSPGQIGQKFPLMEKKTLPPRIRITGAARASVPNFYWHEIDPPLEAITRRIATQPEHVPQEILNEINDFVTDPAKAEYYHGIYHGHPVFVVFDGDDHLASFEKKIVAKTPTEQKEAKNRWAGKQEEDTAKAMKKRKEEVLAEDKKIHTKAVKQVIQMVKKPKKWYKDTATGKWKKIKPAVEDYFIKSAKNIKQIQKLAKKAGMKPDQEIAPEYAQYLKDMGISKSPKRIKRIISATEPKNTAKKLKSDIAKKVRAVKYPASGRGPSYQRYLQKLRDKRAAKKKVK